MVLYHKFNLDKLGKIVDASNIGITDEKALYTIPDWFSVHPKSQGGIVCSHCGKAISIELK